MAKMRTTAAAKAAKKSTTRSSKRTTVKRRPDGKDVKDLRCTFCRKKATGFLAGHAHCGGFHPKVQPVVRPSMRKGRGAFLRMLQARISKVPFTALPEVVEYRQLVQNVVDDSAAKYTGE